MCVCVCASRRGVVVTRTEYTDGLVCLRRPPSPASVIPQHQRFLALIRVIRGVKACLKRPLLPLLQRPPRSIAGVNTIMSPQLPISQHSHTLKCFLLFVSHSRTEKEVVFQSPGFPGRSHQALWGRIAKLDYGTGGNK